MAAQANDALRGAWARVTGILLVLTNGTAMFGNWVRDTSLSPGNPVGTAAKMAASQTFVRLGLAAELITVAGVIPLIVGLYVVLKPVGRSLALLALSWRFMENAILAMLVFTSLEALTLIGGGTHLRNLTPGETSDLAYTLVSLHNWGFQVGFLFLGLGQTLFSWLWWKSHYVPRGLAGLGVVGSAVMAVMAIAITVWPPLFGRVGIVYMAPMGVYEIGLGLWLTVRGVSLTDDYA